MRTKKIDLTKFAKEYAENYDRLITGAVEESRGMVSYGDDFLKSRHPLIGELVRMRNDFFTSDREVNALALTLIEYSITKESKLTYK